MKDINKYYKKTENTLPHPMVRKFINMNLPPQKAVDLGCGAGNDTVFLIKNGWNVIAIDRENVEDIILNKLTTEQKKNLNFQKQNFENIQLVNNNLVLANFSIPFCPNEYFSDFWNKIDNSIFKDRLFRWEFFWYK